MSQTDATHVQEGREVEGTSQYKVCAYIMHDGYYLRFPLLFEGNAVRDSGLIQFTSNGRQQQNSVPGLRCKKGLELTTIIDTVGKIADKQGINNYQIKIEVQPVDA